MKVTVMKKATVTNLTHGFRYSTDVDKYENVSSITETTVAVIGKVYQINYMNGDTTATAQYAQNDYIVNIMP